MIVPICVPCGQAMRCQKNNFLVNDPSSDSRPATYWYGDKWRCPNCGHEIVTGFGACRVPADELGIQRAIDSLEFKY